MSFLGALCHLDDTCDPLCDQPLDSGTAGPRAVTAMAMHAVSQLPLGKRHSFLDYEFVDRHFALRSVMEGSTRLGTASKPPMANVRLGTPAGRPGTGAPAGTVNDRLDSCFCRLRRAAQFRTMQVD
jgi:hypothetical protein